MIAVVAAAIAVIAVVAAAIAFAAVSLAFAAAPRRHVELGGGPGGGGRFHRRRDRRRGGRRRGGRRRGGRRRQGWGRGGRWGRFRLWLGVRWAVRLLGVGRPDVTGRFGRHRGRDDQLRRCHGRRIGSGSGSVAGSDVPALDSPRHAYSSPSRSDWTSLDTGGFGDADRLRRTDGPLASHGTRRGAAGDERPALLQRDRDHREADRGSGAEQRERGAPRPRGQGVAQDPSPDGRGQQLSQFPAHRWTIAHRRREWKGNREKNQVLMR
jgi:hypothetical protein